jgi:tRNA(fMet)-specific endonuclease VapC
LKLRSELLSKHPDEIKVPSIVKAELLCGAAKSRRKEENEKIILSFLFPYQIVAFGSSEAEAYAETRAVLEKEGNIIGPNDLVVAATVKANDGMLITNNAEEFARVKQLNIANWLEN